MDSQSLSIPVRITLLDESVMVEVNPARQKGSTSIVPLTRAQMERLRDACPDEDNEPWRGEPT